MWEYLFVKCKFLFILVYELNKIKNNYKSNYLISIYIKDKVFKTIGFLDTGNMLIDPYTNKPIILLENDSFFDNFPYLLVPYNTIDNHSLLRCIKPDRIEINDVLI